MTAGRALKWNLKTGDRNERRKEENGSSLSDIQAKPLFQRLVGSLSSRVRLAASGAVVVLLAAECVLLLFR